MPAFNYSSTAWRKHRLKVLRAGKYTCAICGVKCYGKTNKGRGAISPHVDHRIEIKDMHLPEHRHLNLNPWTLSNLQVLCGPCHSRKTRTQHKPQYDENGFPPEWQ